MKKYFPLKNYNLSIPEAPHPGAFGVSRKYDVHTGVDLYCDPGTFVYSIEEGVVIGVIPFTGPKAGLPWWNDTYAILIKGRSGIILYGEITPDFNIKPGDQLGAGSKIGKVETVLKIDKNKPMTMIHVELYNQEILDGFIWKLQMPKPQELEDPTSLLKSLKII